MSTPLTSSDAASAERRRPREKQQRRPRMRRRTTTAAVMAVTVVTRTLDLRNRQPQAPLQQLQQRQLPPLRQPLLSILLKDRSQPKTLMPLHQVRTRISMSVMVVVIKTVWPSTLAQTMAATAAKRIMQIQMVFRASTV